MIIETYNNQSRTVTKYLHYDGSETCIKTVPSCSYKMDRFGFLREEYTDREKFSVFISHSSGCKLGCKMCYLTVKNHPYKKLTADQIKTNVKESLLSKMETNPELKDRYLKLCWMGMGDAVLDLNKTYDVTMDLFEWASKISFCKGFDGVDIGTILPTIKNLKMLNRLNIRATDYVYNPNNTKRSPVRLFYSLHSILNRDLLIPKHPYSDSDMFILSSLLDICEIDIIFHIVFIEGINDTDAEIAELIKLFKNLGKYCELRVLRFNECVGSPFKESSRFGEIVQVLNKNVPRIKYQISPGKEIMAACGQFMD